MLKDLDESDIYAIMQKENHFICQKCRQWKKNINIGNQVAQEFSISTSQLAKNLSGVLTKKERYICSACKRKIIQRKAALWATFVGLVVYILIKDAFL